MKIFLIFPVILSAILNRAVVNLSTPTRDEIFISPLYFGKDSTFIVRTRSSDPGIKFYISNDLFQNKQLTTEHTVKGNVHYYKYNNEYTRPTNEFYIAITSGKKPIYSDSITLTPASDSYRYLVNNESFASNCKVYVYSVAKRTWSSQNVEYSFTNFDGLYMPDYYHKIRLEDFSINLSSNDCLLFDCNPSLVIFNVDGVFDDISTSSLIEFQLQLVETSAGFTFALKDTLYVHKETLLMSKSLKPGYVATRHIFLPRNQMRDQEKYKAYFSLKNFGVDKDFVKHNFELRALKNIIGDCQNSEYCIQRL